MTIYPGSYEYCKVFIKVETREQAIEILRSSLPEAEVSGFLATVGSIEMDVLRNTDGDPSSPDFVQWGVTVDIVNDDNNPYVVSLVAAIVRAGWESGTPVVAACDYEMQLPWGGGIARLRSRHG